MNRIYHHHDKWEEVRFGMYNPIPSGKKNQLIQQVLDYFRQPTLVDEYMGLVIERFTNSCEHNFTNPNMNKIAWLGQASVSLYRQIPAEVTMIAWNYLSIQEQEKANSLAEKHIKRWNECQKNI